MNFDTYIDWLMWALIFEWHVKLVCWLAHLFYGSVFVCARENYARTFGNATTRHGGNSFVAFRFFFRKHSMNKLIQNEYFTWIYLSNRIMIYHDLYLLDAISVCRVRLCSREKLTEKRQYTFKSVDIKSDGFSHTARVVILSIFKLISTHCLIFLSVRKYR